MKDPPKELCASLNSKFKTKVQFISLLLTLIRNATEFVCAVIHALVLQCELWWFFGGSNISYYWSYPNGLKEVRELWHVYTIH